ncbi:MAG: flagellar biosynthetic protein FliO [Lachnospiraceae bacterium]|nr:flagellar biosynthetic protein FliO [Lachnospiraceae bacterium]MBO7601230.1 flagellar biosynthetic protein FliO [Lachnospiraceae bacterium]
MNTLASTVLSTASSAGQLITVLLIFAFVLFITWFATRFVGNFQKERMEGANITVVETQRIAPNKYIQIVKIGDRYFAIAVCKDSVTTISEISSESLDLSNTEKEKFSFKEFLNKAKEEEKDN